MSCGAAKAPGNASKILAHGAFLYVTIFQWEKPTCDELEKRRMVTRKRIRQKKQKTGHVFRKAKILFIGSLNAKGGT